jgi:hypothetical protein
MRRLELHIDGLADVVGVFHLGLGERGAAGDAPIHGLLAAIDEALRDEVREEAQFVRLVFLVEREVGILPVAEDAEALELGALEVNVFARVGVAGGADGGGVARGVAGLAHVLRDLELDGQAVAVPAGDVGRVEAAQRLVFDDDVLEHLVQRGADVDIAVREGRAVVEDELGLARAGGANLRVNGVGLPAGEALRFARDEVGLHGEVRARQVQRVLVVHDCQRAATLAAGRGPSKRRGGE